MTEEVPEHQETTPLLNPTEDARPKSSITKRNRLIVAIITILGILAVSSWSIYRITHRIPVVTEPLKVRLYTHNIRFDNKHTDPNERKWSKRKQLVTSSIDFNTDSGNANVVCLQEVLHNQLVDILYNLNNENRTAEWTYYGVGRTDGMKEGEYAPILYKRSEWELVENRTFWLSETPKFPSRGWDAALERIVTMVTLQSAVNPLIRLNFFNTHFDHRGVKARRESARLIGKKMENYNDYPSFLCGDFNTQPTDEPYQLLYKHGFKDSRTLIDKLHSYGHNGTFTGFDNLREARSVIDYIWAPYFAQNGNQLSVLSEDTNYYNFDIHQSYKILIRGFTVLHSYFHGFYMSDHRPVSADYYVYRI